MIEKRKIRNQRKASLPLSKKKGDKGWKGGHGRNKNSIKTKKKRSRELPSTYEKKILETKQTKRLKSEGWHEHIKKDNGPWILPINWSVEERKKVGAVSQTSL